MAEYLNSLRLVFFFKPSERNLAPSSPIPLLKRLQARAEIAWVSMGADGEMCAFEDGALT